MGRDSVEPGAARGCARDLLPLARQSLAPPGLVAEKAGRLDSPPTGSRPCLTSPLGRGVVTQRLESSSFADRLRLFSSPSAPSTGGRWLTDPAVARDLMASWQTANAWIIGRYVLMPDHLHLFCAPVDETFTIESWITFWKRSFRRLHGNANRRFQSGGFHHRLRRQDSYAERWDYMGENPVRAGLVKSGDEWPYSGELNELRW